MKGICLFVVLGVILGGCCRCTLPYQPDYIVAEREATPLESCTRAFPTES